MNIFSISGYKKHESVHAGGDVREISRCEKDILVLPKGGKGGLEQSFSYENMNQPGILLQCRFGLDSRFCISDELRGDAVAAGWRTTFWGVGLTGEH